LPIPFCQSVCPGPHQKAGLPGLRSLILLVGRLLILGWLASAPAVMAQAQPNVVISGEVSAVVRKNILQHLGLGSEHCQISERRRAVLLDGADEKIRQALQALGYYHARWHSALSSNDQCWTITIELTPGTATTLDRVQVEIDGDARNDPAFARLLETSLPKTGEQLNHDQYETLKQSLQKLAQQRGYAESHFTRQQLQISLESQRADILLGFNSGPRYHFGSVNFEQAVFDDAFLAQFLPFSAATPFHAPLLGQFQQSLINSRYFDQVVVTQLPPERGTQQIPVQVVLTPGPRYSTSLGVGVATDTGPRGSIGFRNNRANQKGHRYGADAQLSRVKSIISLEYQIPLQQPDTEFVTLKTGWEEEDTDSADSETWFVGAAHSRSLDNGWIRTLDLVYRVESFAVGDDRSSTELVVPGIGWQKTRADNPAYPFTGWRTRFSLRGAAESLGSDLSFLQLQGSGKYILPLLGGRLLGRLEGGLSLMSNFEEMPSSFRFFAGGDNSVRGYDYEELGPLNDGGDVVGGRHLLTASVEYDYPVYKNYALAVFYDVGNAFDNSSFTLKRSFGVGLRWRSPLGPIRLDLAFPDTSEQAFRIHLSMGPDL